MTNIEPTFHIEGYELFLTCMACPEQYDVYYKDWIVGYLRLRHGCFTVTVPDVGGETILTTYPKGDGLFEADEREYYLTKAIHAIKSHQFKAFANRQLQ